MHGLISEEWIGVQKQSIWARLQSGETTADEPTDIGQVVRPVWPGVFAWELFVLVIVANFDEILMEFAIILNQEIAHPTIYVKLWRDAVDETLLSQQTQRVSLSIGAGRRSNHPGERSLLVA